MSPLSLYMRDHRDSLGESNKYERGADRLTAAAAAIRSAREALEPLVDPDAVAVREFLAVLEASFRPVAVP